ncbi:MAG TPA: hypothetical protein VG848_00440 [Acetobacteraceae bacterium]|nr:hypothetical protein [Acetobacteraceae bacterium]
MPTTIIAAASCGDAVLAASQVLAFTAYASALPTILFDLSPSGPKSELIPSIALSPREAPRVLRGLGASVSAFVRVTDPSAQAVEPLLGCADALLIAATRFPAGLEAGLALYRSLAALEAAGRAGRVVEPWLLPIGWSSTRLPSLRLRDWQRDLAREGGEDLRCLPLVMPWSSLGSVAMAHPARLQAVGERVLQYLREIAAGRAPERPRRGIEDGDPWPASLPSEEPLRLASAGLRPRLRLVHGA